ncbi:MAG: aminoacyl-tRNA hydrolase, partial [Planctomycetes bacterium]|nr:aminoacyl-tRNA hydrolase [Planctomycetota bacterium]
MIEINEEDLRYAASRSSGPGGQHVNKVNTRIMLWFDLERNTQFSASQKARLREKLSTRLDKLGRLRVASQRYRSQRANREAALVRLQALLEEALKEPAVRVRTRVPRSVIRKRLDEKRQRSVVKRQR